MRRGLRLEQDPIYLWPPSNVPLSQCVPDMTIYAPLVSMLDILERNTMGSMRSQSSHFRGKEGKAQRGEPSHSQAFCCLKAVRTC
jgi:hypothetical protein